MKVLPIFPIFHIVICIDMKLKAIEFVLNSDKNNKA